jgi:hypothetical protein
VKTEESALPWSSIDALVKRPAAMFLRTVLDTFWVANRSRSLSTFSEFGAAEIGKLGLDIVSAVTACSDPSESNDKCQAAVFHANQNGPKFAVLQFILGCINGIAEISS